MPVKLPRLLVLLAVITANAAAASDQLPLPMRTAEPIVYATPIANTVILEFKLYDNRTWCRLYLTKEAWDELRANDGALPAGVDIGQLHCERH